MPQQRHRARSRDDEAPIIPILARKAREVEAKAQGGKVGPTNRTKFQVIALLMREERAKIKNDQDVPETVKEELLKRLVGIGQILAKTAARDTSLITLLEPDASVSSVASRFRRDWLIDSGVQLDVDELIITQEAPVEVEQATVLKQVIPGSVKAKLLANPFRPPEFDKPASSKPAVRLLSNWELLSPLFKSFETGAGGVAASMSLPDAPKIDRLAPKHLELMVHQARFIESARLGHRSFLLADEPGLGKTAQSILAASVSDAFPLLAVVPNVVKMNWAREVAQWTPKRRATVIHGDGERLDAFADVVIVNYDILDRHIQWLGKLGFRGMVVDEAHFIKNLSSQRSKNVLSLADTIRANAPQNNPLMMALTGTPLINDVDDFRAIWQFLGWIKNSNPSPRLMEKLEETGLTPADLDFYSHARRSVIDMGIVRRRKVDVAKDLPAKRIADLPVELDDEVGRSIAQAENDLAKRLKKRYFSLLAAKKKRETELDDEERSAYVLAVAKAELEESKSTKTGENVFTMVRKIGQAKALLAADYAAQLARSVGKVVFFAKHIDVMDQAEESFAKKGLTTVSLRGDQTAIERQAAIDAFHSDPDVSVAVCSLMAAGVGVNLQASSNVVLAELSWTAAEQTQAIDRVHRIGQEEPVTAWRIIAAHTIDAKIAELIDNKSSLAARALDGSHEETTQLSIHLSALVHILESSLEKENREG